MKKILFLLTALYSSITLFSQQEKYFPNVEGWKKPAEIQHYDAGTLFEVIDGAAENYLKYGFIELYMGDYTQGEDYMTVEIYSMKTQLLAFGIYASERRPDASFIQLGAEGYAEKGTVNFQYGPYYIKLHSNKQTDEMTTEAIKIGKAMTTSFFGCTSMPFELMGFPDESRLAKTEQLIPNDFLGLSFLTSAITCDYSIGGKTYKLVIMNLDSPDKCKETITNYLKYANQSTDAVAEGRYIIKDKYNGKIELGWKGSIIYGVIGVDDDIQRKTILEVFEKKLKEGYLL